MKILIILLTLISFSLNCAEKKDKISGSGIAFFECTKCKYHCKLCNICNLTIMLLRAHVKELTHKRKLSEFQNQNNKCAIL